MTRAYRVKAVLVFGAAAAIVGLFVGFVVGVLVLQFASTAMAALVAGLVSAFVVCWFGLAAVGIRR